MLCQKIDFRLAIVAFFMTLAFSISVTLAQTTEITVLTAGGEPVVLGEIIENFNNSQSDYEGVLLPVPTARYVDYVDALAEDNDLPCIMEMDGPGVYNFAFRDYLIPIDEYISTDDLNDFLPSIIDQGTYRGRLYSLGLFDSGLAIWGNRSYLEAIDARIPQSVDEAWSFEEFNSILKSLKELEDIEYPLDLKADYGESEWYTYGFSPILQSFGGDLIDRENYQTAEGVLNGDASIEAMQWFQSLFMDGLANASVNDATSFVERRSALSWVGHWEYNNYAEALGDDLVLIPMPVLGERAVTGSGSWSWGITSQCDNPDGAWALLKFMLQPDAIIAMTESNGAIPSRLSVLEEDEKFMENGALFIYIEQLNNGIAITRPSTAAYPIISETFANAISRIIRGEDVKDVLNSAVDVIEFDLLLNNGYQQD